MVCFYTRFMLCYAEKDTDTTDDVIDGTKQKSDSVAIEQTQLSTATKSLAVRQVPQTSVNLSHDLTCTSWSETEVSNWLKSQNISDCMER